ncbi:hypothetical protein D3C71_1909480 [compost metagenome]
MRDLVTEYDAIVAKGGNRWAIQGRLNKFRDSMTQKERDDYRRMLAKRIVAKSESK